jgi:hypothetical protein
MTTQIDEKMTWKTMGARLMGWRRSSLSKNPDDLSGALTTIPA